MRVLLNGLIASHLSPMLPLAWALRAAGHDLLVVGGTDVAAAGRAAGLNAVPVTGATRNPGGETGPGRARAERSPRAEESSRPEPSRRPEASPRPGASPQTGAPPQPGSAAPAGSPPWDRILAGKEPQLRAGLGEFVELLAGWRPDLVLTDPFGYGIQVAAAISGIPVVVHELGAWDSSVAMNAAARRVFGPLCRERGAEAGLPEPALVIDPTPALLRAPDAGPAHEVRHIPFSGAERIPGWALAPADGERVCVVFGVWGTRLLADSGRLGEVIGDIAGAAGTVAGRETVVLLDEEHHPAVGALPAGVRLHAPLPLDLVLRGCSAVVHHGGSGSTLTAAAHRVPQVVLPAQQPQLAAAGRRVEAAGVGRALTEADGDLGKAVATALDQVTHDPSVHRAAVLAGDQIAAMPTPASLVPRLTELASA
ncbi:nucleotide disphospho-sugar-binding domain-containing protein [Streptomyces sp. CA-249302]|uniref:nucleotide disphospho-sugar-binding domain-containing protein n=1 Tax=Streptomyces sp. CA-249302 TaxID=3240058 RepID=UPI003D9234B1